MAFWAKGFDDKNIQNKDVNANFQFGGHQSFEPKNNIKINIYLPGSAPTEVTIDKNVMKTWNDLFQYLWSQNIIKFCKDCGLIAMYQQKHYKGDQSMNIPDNAYVGIVYNNVGGGMVSASLRDNDEILVFAEPKNYDYDSNKHIYCKSYHVSCKSDPIPKDSLVGAEMTGIILYRYNNKIDWKLNGIHCKTGYIVIKNKSAIKDINTDRNTLHSKCFKFIFGSDMSSASHWEIVGGGFAIYQNKIKYNSGTFNINGIAKDKFHDNNKEMHPIETLAVTEAINNWRFKKQQNTLIKDMKLRENMGGYCDYHFQQH